MNTRRYILSGTLSLILCATAIALGILIPAPLFHAIDNNQNTVAATIADKYQMETVNTGTLPYKTHTLQKM